MMSPNAPAVLLERERPVLTDIPSIRSHLERISTLFSSALRLEAYRETMHALNAAELEVDTDGYFAVPGFEAISEQDDGTYHTSGLLFVSSLASLKTALAQGSVEFTGQYYCDTASTALLIGLQQCLAADSHISLRLIRIDAALNGVRNDKDYDSHHAILYALDNLTGEELFVDPTHGQTDPQSAGRIAIMSRDEVPTRYALKSGNMVDVTAYWQSYVPGAVVAGLGIPATAAQLDEDFQHLVRTVTDFS